MSPTRDEAYRQLREAEQGGPGVVVKVTGPGSLTDPATGPAARGNADYPPPTPILRSGGEALRGHDGPLEYRPTACQATVEGEQECTVRATWRVTVQDCDGASWLICQPHLGEAVMLADENYGVPVLVSRA